MSTLIVRRKVTVLVWAEYKHIMRHDGRALACSGPLHIIPLTLTVKEKYHHVSGTVERGQPQRIIVRTEYQHSLSTV